MLRRIRSTCLSLPVTTSRQTLFPRQTANCRPVRVGLVGSLFGRELLLSLPAHPQSWPIRSSYVVCFGATCGALDLRASVQLSIIGALDNGCDSAQTLPPPLSLSTPSTGAFVLGEPGVTATLHTSGVLNISNATDIPVWEFDVPRGARSATKLPPACFAKTVCADELAFVLVCAHGYFSSSATGANGVDRLISASDALITRTC